MIAHERPGQGRVDRPAGGGAAAIWMPFEWLAPAPFLAELMSLPLMLRTTRPRPFRPADGRSGRHGSAPIDGPPACVPLVPRVAPAAQGRGVGSALLRAAAARLDAAPHARLLETGTTRTSPSTNVTDSR